MNPERLRELLRQRELVQTHLAWLDREIAQARMDDTGGAAATAGLPAASAPNLSAPSAGLTAAAPTPGLPPAPEFASNLTADPVLAGYNPDPRSAALNARRGCFVAFAAALLLLFGVLLGIYWLRYRDHPLLFAPREAAPAETPAATPPPPAPRK